MPLLPELGIFKRSVLQMCRAYGADSPREWLKSLLRRWWRCCRRASRRVGTAWIRTRAPAHGHLLILSELIGRQHGLHLVHRILSNRHELGTAVVHGERGVRADGVYLLVLSFEDGLDLRRLVIGQVQGGGEPFNHPVNIGRPHHPAAPRVSSCPAVRLPAAYWWNPVRAPSWSRPASRPPLIAQ